MELLQELSLLRAQASEITSALDRMIAAVIAEANEPQRGALRDYEATYRLQAPLSFFKNTKPTGVFLPNGTRKNVSTWKQCVIELLNDCIKDNARKQKLYRMRGLVAGRNRTFIDDKKGAMRSPVKIDSQLFIETHYDTETLLHVVLERILAPVDYDFSAVKVTLRN